MKDFPGAMCVLGAGLEAVSTSQLPGWYFGHEPPCLCALISLSCPSCPQGNTSDKKRDMGAGAQQCALALASGAGLYAVQSADPKSLRIALGVVGDTEQGQS